MFKIYTSRATKSRSELKSLNQRPKEPCFKNVTLHKSGPM